MSETTPIPRGTKVTYYGCGGEIEQIQRDPRNPDQYRYLIRWATGHSGWWGHERIVADMNPSAEGER